MHNGISLSSWRFPKCTSDSTNTGSFMAPCSEFYLGPASRYDPMGTFYHTSPRNLWVLSLHSPNRMGPHPCLSSLSECTSSAGSFIYWGKTLLWVHFSPSGSCFQPAPSCVTIPSLREGGIQIFFLVKDWPSPILSFLSSHTSLYSPLLTRKRIFFD